MDSRRAFLKKVAMLAGSTAAINWLPESIQKALAIEAPKGSTFLDAEHVVFLMQENRSFDHCYGTLKGVRGFNDPRAMKLPNGLPVWIQGNKEGAYFAPFHLDIINSKSTWMGSLPHGWRDMVAARHDGKMDNWLEAKSSGNDAYKSMPLTMGYYNRADIPFYYAFADAFTVCDQHFCSSLTGTSANRSYFWTGTIREQPRNPESLAHVDNGQINYKDVSWKTYPERLQEAGIPWRVYQNELSLPVGFEGEEEDWLANFTDNNLEFHKQYGVRYHPAHYQWMKKRIETLQQLVKGNEKAESLSKAKAELARLQRDVMQYSPENFEKLSQFEKDIHRNAFVTNMGDSNYHKLDKIAYTADGKRQEIEVPAGDVLYQFRKDVEAGKLPTVSWLVAPCRFSDHPGSPWYGAWYVSEVLDILIRNPEVWKKTIFILTYDENDGYFDHIAPFVPPLSSNSDQGAVTIDTTDEYVTQKQERKRTNNQNATLESPIGLGYRVPMVIASPWSKGGWVNSEVFDHTSCLQFLEHFLERKTGKVVREENISSWRRMVCGDLTTAFRPIDNVSKPNVLSVDRNAYVERIFSARNKKLPTDFVQIDNDKIAEIRAKGRYHSDVQMQEHGWKNACALPYDLQIKMRSTAAVFSISATLDKRLDRIKAGAGIPYFVISYVPYDGHEKGKVWNFAVQDGDQLQYDWQLDKVSGDRVSFALHGPNGFYRSVEAKKVDIPNIDVYTKIVSGNPVLCVEVQSSGIDLQVVDSAYGTFESQILKSGAHKVIEVDCSESKGWYDVEVTSPADPQLKLRYAGHIETGLSSYTDPLMGGMIR
ncbi:phospholipase C, phosphocholine-specific [Sphingobacterium sp. InxBP1]|uniref:phosphocholine-specific phospholipase C n=1 Tax=Sphingobacterium sp. InxBP1 TaxID=2870328 RepID=UPI002243DAFF|nr:phospholipase C, phosphocholine-specific [Sphingobacterium sp. InxBP1]MCW8310861.1 phospholipase C, phosphocholine-specific [Sphingobacterium sp. InxBP1]